MDNAYEFSGMCWNYLSKKEKKELFLSITNFVRPEDIHLVEGYFEAVKLATRVNKNPVGVLKAYMNEKYSGGIMDLLEPNHAGLWFPYILENSKIDKDFFERVLPCNKNCKNCSYCKEVYNNALVKLEECLC